jgi:hypothetical protein
MRLEWNDSRTYHGGDRIIDERREQRHIVDPVDEFAELTDEQLGDKLYQLALRIPAIDARSSLLEAAACRLRGRG